MSGKRMSRVQRHQKNQLGKTSPVKASEPVSKEVVRQVSDGIVKLPPKKRGMVERIMGMKAEGTLKNLVKENCLIFLGKDKLQYTDKQGHVGTMGFQSLADIMSASVQ